MGKANGAVPGGLGCTGLLMPMCAEGCRLHGPCCPVLCVKRSSRFLLAEGLARALLALSAMCGGAAGWEREIASSAGARAHFGFKINPNFLAGRARKRRGTFGSGAELCQAALRLLDRHQNLNDLLLEVGAGQGPREMPAGEGFPSGSFPGQL